MLYHKQSLILPRTVSYHKLSVIMSLTLLYYHQLSVILPPSVMFLSSKPANNNLSPQTTFHVAASKPILSNRRSILSPHPIKSILPFSMTSPGIYTNTHIGLQQLVDKYSRDETCYISKTVFCSLASFNIQNLSPLPTHHPLRPIKSQL